MPLVVAVYKGVFGNNFYSRKWFGAEGGIWTHEPLRDKSLSLTPLTMLGDLRFNCNRFEALRKYRNT
jgi:hypothetical protein